MYKISPELTKALINYLVNRPYVEVYQAVQALQSLEKIKEEMKESTKPETNDGPANHK